MSVERRVECRVECCAYFTVVKVKCKTANAKCVFDTSRRERTIENANDKMQNELLEYKMHLLKNKMQ